MFIELLDVLLGGADRCEAELKGMSAVSGKDGNDGDGKDLAVGEVDELRNDGSEENAEPDGIEVIEA